MDINRVAVALSIIAIIIAGAGVAWINTAVTDVQSNLRKNIDSVSSDVSTLKTSVNSLSSDVKKIIQQANESASKPRGVFELDMSQVIEGAKKEGKMVWWSIHEIELMAAMKEAFETKYPFIQVEFAKMSSSDLKTKGMTEYRAGKYSWDLMSDSVGSLLPYFNERNTFLQPFPQFLMNALKTDNWIQGTYDPDGYYIAQAFLMLGVLYNTDMVKPADLPKTYEELADAKWKGTMTTDAPGRGGQFSTMFAELKPILGEEKWLNLLKGIAALQPTPIPSSGSMAKAVLSGQYAIGVGGIQKDVFVESAKGAPLGFVDLNPVVANPSVFIYGQKAPHPNAAILFVHWMITEGQKLHEKIEMRTPANPLIKSTLSLSVLFPGKQIIVYGNKEYYANNKPYLDLYKQIFGQYA